MSITSCCPICGTLFQHKPSHNRIYCNMKCKGLAKRKKVTVHCLTCNAEIVKHPSSKRKFCSLQCSAKYQEMPCKVECKECHQLFDSVPSAKRQYCSIACRYALPTRFWKHTDVKAPSECWEWRSSKRGKGYGYLETHRKKIAAHRFSWQLHNGPIPAGLFVCHHCDNPSCVNPHHLFLGTVQDNSDDMVGKGRSVKGRRYSGLIHRGETSTNAKLTNAEVTEIRSIYANGQATQEELARCYHVDQTTISKIVLGKTYAHADPS